MANEMVPYQPSEERPAFWCNWSIQDDAGRNLALRCRRQPDYTGDDVKDKVFTVTGVLMHPVAITNTDTGEVSDEIRTVFVMKDGKTLAFVSRGVASAMRWIIALVGKERWRFGVNLTFKKIKARQGFTYDVELAEDQPETPPAKKGR